MIMIGVKIDVTEARGRVISLVGKSERAARRNAEQPYSEINEIVERIIANALENEIKKIIHTLTNEGEK
jgi:hypothetical protein